MSNHLILEKPEDGPDAAADVMPCAWVAKCQTLSPLFRDVRMGEWMGEICQLSKFCNNYRDVAELVRSPPAPPAFPNKFRTGLRFPPLGRLERVRYSWRARDDGRPLAIQFRVQTKRGRARRLGEGARSVVRGNRPSRGGETDGHPEIAMAGVSS